MTNPPKTTRSKKKILSLIKGKGFLYAKEISIDDVEKQFAPKGVFDNSNKAEVMPGKRAKFFIARHGTQTVLLQYYKEKTIGPFKNERIEVMITFTYKPSRKRVS